MRDFLHLHRPGAWVWLLLAATLFMRAVMPSGYMAERTDAGSIIVTVCNSDMQLEIPLKRAGDAPEKGHGSPAPCAFAALSAHAAPAPDIALPSPAEATALAHWPDRLVAVQRRGTRNLPPARGPPVTV